MSDATAGRGAAGLLADAAGIRPSTTGARSDELRTAAAELRDLGRAARVAALAAVFERWRDPASQERRELLQRLPGATGFTPKCVEVGLEVGFEDWSGAAFERLVEAELGGRTKAPLTGAPCATDAAPASAGICALVLAGSIPMPSLLALAAPLVQGCALRVKPASRDPITPALVAASIARASSPLGAALELCTVASRDEAALRAFLDADCIVANGSDETIAALRRLAPAHAPFVAHGHKLSLAALGRELQGEAALERVADALALDTALWDQLGCLSPLAVYVEGDASDAQRFAEALAASLGELEAVMPRGAIDAASATLVAHERAAAELRAASDANVRLWRSAGSEWTVVSEADARWRPAPLHRFLRVHPVADLDALLRALEPLGAHLQGVAIDGFGGRSEGLALALNRIGASRICRPGRLQAPPLDWPRDGRPVLALD